jgi:hypothetical protein
MGVYRRLTALITLTFQLILTTVAALNACVDRPHRHGGVAAPDCAMHHEASASATPEHHHHHADGQPESTSNAKQIRCRCASEPVPLLTAEAAALTDPVSILFSKSAPPIVASMPTAIDFRVAPLSPPPRSLPA